MKVLVNEKIIYANENDILSKVLIENGVELNLKCGGNMKCGACVVKVIGGVNDISDIDRRFFNEEELIKGYRLSCNYKIKNDIKIELIQNKSNTKIILTNNKMSKKAESENKFKICIDIGTTTIGMCLVDIDLNKKIDEYGILNSQKIYGADVLSRIKFCENLENLKKISQLVKNDILKGIEFLLNKFNIEKQNLKQLIITGNTVMLHILRELSPVSIGNYPFKAIDLNGVLTKYKNDDYDFSVLILPCVSGYIGADIVSGVSYLKMYENEEINFLIDLGTNGEMVLGNKNKLLSTSTAAGPAFESAFKSQGINSSNLINMISIALQRQILSRDGLLKSPYFENGLPCGNGKILSQETIREIQLAKSAIITGIEFLVNKYKISYDEIKNVYLAGGFGFYLNVASAVNIGLIPNQLRQKIKVVGNTALLGTLEISNKLENSDKYVIMEKVSKKITNIDLANENGFNERFLKNLEFKKI